MESAQSLASECIERWSELQRIDPALDSPFFRPEFTAAVAQTRNDVFVAVLEDAGRTVGFLPFQRTARAIGKPVGGRLSDFQGLILEPGAGGNPRLIVRACGLRAFEFPRGLASQQLLAPFADKRSSSPRVDLAEGFQSYCRLRSAVGSKVVAHVESKARKCAREVGPLRFTADDGDVGALLQLISWKSAQYRRTSSVNTFASDWATDLLERIVAMRGPDFAGVLSTLYAGDHLVAMHMGMRSKHVLHWWFPTYNPAFARYSPGLVLLLRIAQSAEALGLRAIDLGAGDELYKRRFADDGVPLVEGSVVNSATVRATRRLRSAVSAAVQSAVTTRAVSSGLSALKRRPAGQRGLSFVRTRVPWL